MSRAVPKKPAEPPKKRKLSRIRDIRGALADAARALEAGNIEPDVATALRGLYMSLAEVIRDREIEKRLEAAEGKRRPPKAQPGVDIQ